MAGALNRLAAKTVAALGKGKFCDGGGLWLVKAGPHSGKWAFRFMLNRRAREMGLGRWPEVSLAEARRKAEAARIILREGRDPILDRERKRREAARNLHLLADVARDAFEARKAELKGDGKAGRWFSPLELHVLPRLGRVPVAEIDQTAIRDCLAPIWHAKGDTARKALTRLGIVMRHAAALGLHVDLQACDKARLLLGKSRAEARNIPAMAWQDVPSFYASLSDGTVTHLALRLLILTGVRSAPLRFIREEQIAGDIWVIPAELMKGRKGKTEAFHVPLSHEAQAVIAEARRHARDGFLLPSVRKGVISDATMARLMERRGMEARPHGFRSSLRTWLADLENDPPPYEVAEACLAHSTGTAAAESYNRSLGYLAQRRPIMERWASHVTGGTGQVIRLAGAG